MCSSFHKIQLVVEYLPCSLLGLIVEKKKQNLFFEEDYILNVINCGLQALQFFHQQQIAHQCIQATSILSKEN